MLEHERRLSLGEPTVSPSQHRDEGTVEVPSHVGEKIFVPVRRALVLPSIEDAAGDQAVEPVGQDVRRDRELGQDLVVATVAEEALADDHETPFVADDLAGRAKPSSGGRGRTGFRRKAVWCCGPAWRDSVRRQGRRGTSRRARRRFRRNGSR